MADLTGGRVPSSTLPGLGDDRPVSLAPKDGLPASRAQGPRKKARLSRLGLVVAAPAVGARRHGPLLREQLCERPSRGLRDSGRVGCLLRVGARQRSEGS